MVVQMKLRERFEKLARCTEPGQYATVSGEDVRAVVELIREAEPRVLTLEEVRNPGRMVALEYKTYGILQDDELKPVMTLHKWAVYIGKCFDGDIEWTAFSLFHAFTNQMTLKTDNYGKTWRCWSADPGDEVRKETEWDEA